MAVLEILQVPDPRLREVCAPVESFDNHLSVFIDELLETLYSTTGIGLCAPQVGQLKQVLVMDLSAERNSPEIYVNPEILTRGTPGIVEESCLSLPGIKGNVVRSTEVRVRARDQHGEFFERDLSAMYAVCVQHEMDHLQGVLFTDRLGWFGKLRLRLSGRALRH